MDWTVIGTMTQVASTVAIFVTLLYLSKQVKEGNKRAELEGLRHTLDGFNQWCDLIVGSKQTAEVLNRGREDLESLDRDERLQFDHLHVRFLNTVEGWFRQVDQTSRDADYRETQIENIEAAINGWFGFPGAREVWRNYRDVFPLVENIVDHALEESDHNNSVE